MQIEFKEHGMLLGVIDLVKKEPEEDPTPKPPAEIGMPQEPMVDIYAYVFHPVSLLWSKELTPQGGAFAVQAGTDQEAVIVQVVRQAMGMGDEGD